VPPDTDVSGDPTEITMGPKKVFKTGYPTGKTVDTAGGSLEASGRPHQSGGTMRVKPLVTSRETELLSTHRVADASQVQEILHPKGQSALDSLIRQEAFIVTRDLKVIDVAASEWPIDLEAAPDVRSVLKAPVRYGEEIGFVAGIEKDLVFLQTRQASEPTVVPIQDLEPVMTETTKPEEE